MTKDMVTVFGKLQKTNGDRDKRKRKRDNEAGDVDGSRVSKIFKKRCCLFQLPYWEKLLVRHNIDAMHTEKNVYGNVANTLLAVDKKSKDNLNSRLDLQKMGIRPDLHPQTEGSKSYLPAALYSLSPQEKRMFCQVLKEVKFPAGYASNLPRKNVCSVHLTGSVGQKRSTSKPEASMFDNVRGASESMAGKKLARKVSKEKTKEDVSQKVLSPTKDQTLGGKSVSIKAAHHPNFQIDSQAKYIHLDGTVIRSMNQVRMIGRQGTSIGYRVEV